jgi:hypothetical protein
MGSKISAGISTKASFCIFICIFIFAFPKLQLMEFLHPYLRLRQSSNEGGNIQLDQLFGEQGKFDSHQSNHQTNSSQQKAEMSFGERKTFLYKDKRQAAWDGGACAKKNREKEQ